MQHEDDMYIYTPRDEHVGKHPNKTQDTTHTTPRSSSPVCKVSRHDEVVLHHESRLLRVHDEALDDLCVVCAFVWKRRGDVGIGWVSE